VYLIHDGNTAGASRELSSPSRDCTELLAAVALAISIAVDPGAVELYWQWVLQALAAELNPRIVVESRRAAQGAIGERAGLEEGEVASSVPNRTNLRLAQCKGHRTRVRV